MKGIVLLILCMLVVGASAQTNASDKKSVTRTVGGGTGTLTQIDTSTSVILPLNTNPTAVPTYDTAGNGLDGYARVTSVAEFEHVESDTVTARVLKRGAYRHLRGHFVDSARTIAVTQNVYTPVTSANGNLFIYIETDQFSVVKDSITLNDPQLDDAHFDLYGHLVITGGNGDKFRVKVFKGATELVGSGFVGIGAAATEQELVFRFYDTTANDGDTYVLKITNTADNDDPTIIQGYIAIDYNHE